MTTRKLLTYAQADEILGTSRKYVERRCLRGEIPRVVLGPKTHRIDQADLIAFSEERTARRPALSAVSGNGVRVSFQLLLYWLRRIEGRDSGAHPKKLSLQPELAMRPLSVNLSNAVNRRKTVIQTMEADHAARTFGNNGQYRGHGSCGQRCSGCRYWRHRGRNALGS